ncbi:dethiobiotin synthetase [Candidatus Moduliflexus flocculans]|uniref:ATP-dependent dethiobiotin synthetase BioD n=1 Tax=Candidatus Moduliflexus flocculans TaxID=1499966 RepID=A0A081BPE6_9BACT|nr:dethiobiotin synthetase [Candidatus Moduliflexus flocculans]
MPTIAIVGIDTNVGKTIVTGLIGNYLLRAGHTVITQKIAQTGCVGMSEDIALHRRLMGMELTEEDRLGTTCPYMFALPASPHLSAQQEHQRIEPERIAAATRQLEARYEYVLLEGVGGLYVPLNDDIALLDYLAEQQYPLIVVSSAKLGSINHTLLTLEAARNRALSVLGIVYNLYPAEHPLIVEDSQRVFRQYLKRFGYAETVIAMPAIEMNHPIPAIDFAPLFHSIGARKPHRF